MRHTVRVIEHLFHIEHSHPTIFFSRVRHTLPTLHINTLHYMPVTQHLFHREDNHPTSGCPRTATYQATRWLTGWRKMRRSCYKKSSRS